MVVNTIMFKFYRHIHLYETDLMGVVHHSNYLRYLEEARSAWAVERGFLSYQRPESAAYFTVYESRVKYLKPLRYGDEIEIFLQARRVQNRIHMEYKITTQTGVTTLAETVHVPLNKDLKLIRWSAEITEKMEKELWTETWL